MARDITVHFVGNARDLVTSAAIAGESVERFGRKVVTAGAESAAASAGFDLASIHLLDMGRQGVTPTNMLVALGVAATVAASPAIAALTGFLGDLTLGLTLLGGLAGLGGSLVALTAWSQGWLDAGKNLEKASKELDAAKEAVERATRPTKAQLDRLKEAQDNYNAALKAADNPLTNFNNHIQEMGRRLGTQALPVATRILQWADSMIPRVEELGSRLISWFGPRLEPTLVAASKLFDDVMTTLEELGRAMTPVFDKLLKNPDEFRQAFVKAAGMVIGAVTGLVNNFQRLADWWVGPEGQHFQSQAEAVLSLVGHLVEALIVSFYAIAKAMSFVGDRFSELGSAVRRFTGPLERAISLWDTLMGKLGQRRLPSIGGGGGGGPTEIGGDFQHGGIVPGAAGAPMLAVVHGGETVLPLGGAGAMRGGHNITIYISGESSPEATAAAVDRRLSRLLTAT